MSELEEDYVWLRQTPRPSADIPHSYYFKLWQLLHDIDKRITKLEKPAQALEDDGK